MGEVVPIGEASPTRPNATTGQALFAAIVDEFSALGLKLPPRVIATAAKQGKESLEAGVDPTVVLAGCLSAIKQGKQRYTSEIIADIVLAASGNRSNPSEYRRELDHLQSQSDPTMQRITETLDRLATEKKERKHDST